MDSLPKLFDVVMTVAEILSFFIAPGMSEDCCLGATAGLASSVS